MSMVPTAALRKVFRNMGPGFGSLAKSKEEYALHALSGIDRNDALQLRDQITILLASYSPEDLRSWWQDVAISTYFKDSSDLVEFLTNMRVHLNQPPFTLK